MFKKSNTAAWRTVRLAGASILAFGTVLSPAVAQENDTLVVGRSMDVNSLDPARAFCDTCQIYLSAVYDTLVGLGEDNRSLIPELAESWESNEDFTEFTFSLRDGAIFADGSPVEPADVVWTFERLKNLQASPSFLMDGVTSVEPSGEKTVTITLDAPNAEFLNKLSAPYAGIVNSDLAREEAGAIADETAAEADRAEGWFLENSAGSGPFTLDGYSPDNELRFARNDSYWGDAPYFATVVMTQIQDAVGQAQALESGSVDVAMQVDADTAASIRSGDVTTETVPSFNFLYLALSPGAEGMQDVLTPAVREAVALAIDYEGMIEFTTGGSGNPQAAPIPNGFPGTADLTPRSQNLQQARLLMEQAGMADGFSMVAGYPNDNVYGVDINVMMQKAQQDLREIGIDLELKPWTYAVWREELNGAGIPMTGLYYAPDYYGSGQYPAYFAMMAGTTWLARAGQDDQEALINPEEADLYAEALASEGAAAEEAYAAIGRAMMDDAVILPMVSPDLVLAYRNDIAGVRYSACCNLPLAELSRE